MTRRIHRSIGLALLVVTCVMLQGCSLFSRDGATVGNAPVVGDTFEIEVALDAPLGKPAVLKYGAHSAGVPPEVLATSEPPVVWPGGSMVAIRHLHIATEAAEEDGTTRTTHYSIESFIVQEEVDGQWETFSEFHPVKQYATDIGVVIVLDNSMSLKDQLEQNKVLATELGKALLEDERIKGMSAVAVMPLALPASQEITFTRKTLDVALQARAVKPYAYTPLYAGIGQAIMLFDDYEQSSPSPRDPFGDPFKFEEKYIVVISDGQDTSSVSEKPATVEKQLTARSDIAVYVLAVKGSDRIHEERLTRLVGANTDRYIDLSEFDPQSAAERMTAVKDTILQSCVDRYNLFYQRSGLNPGFSGRLKFVITAVAKDGAQTDLLR